MKVFLSVSGESYAPFVNLIYSKLKDAGLEVVRYEGGTYSPNPMLACDYVFMIPPYSENSEFIVGKGQHEELRHLNAKSMWNKTYMLTTYSQKRAVEVPTDALIGRTITSNTAIQGSTDWKKGFAKVTTTNALSLSNIINIVLKEKAKEVRAVSALPPIWCVEVTEESKEALGIWRSSGKLPQSTKSGFCFSPNYVGDSRGYYEEDRRKDVPVITFAQFKEHVLGKKPSTIQEEQKVGRLERETPFGDPIEGGVELLHDKSGSLVAKMPNPNYKGLPFEEMKKLLIPLS